MRRRLSLRRATGAATLALGLARSPLEADSFHVAPGGSDAASGTSWSEALATIQEATRRAVATPVPDDVFVAPGRYAENFTLPPGTSLHGSVDPVSGRMDPDRWPTVVDGRGLGAVVTCDPLADGSVLEGFFLTGGHSALNGGGIDCPTASPVIRNNRIVANRADADGGGMSAADGSPLIEGNLFLANEAGDDAGGLRLARTAAVIRGNAFVGNRGVADGGGLRLRDAVAATVVVEDNWFVGNATGVNGGGLSVVNANVRTERNTYERNVAGGEGGGLSVRDCPSTIVMREVALANQAQNGGGMAFRNAGGAVTASLLAGNVATADGGGVRARQGGPLTVRDSVFSGNSASNGGGGIAFAGLAGNSVNNLVLGNTALQGGALFADTVPGATPLPATVNASNNTLRLNEITGGTGAASHTAALSTLAFIDGIVWGNLGGPALGGAGTDDFTYTAVDEVVGGTANFNLDPLFTPGGPLANAWAIEDSYLSEAAAGQPTTSPCVDSGDRPSSALGLDAFTTRTDEVPDGGVVDRGFHPPVGAGFWGFDVYRSISPRVPGALYLAGPASGVVDPEPVLEDASRPLLTYRIRGLPLLSLTKSGPSVALQF